MQPATFRVLLLLLYSTGVRVGEALRLTLRDVDLHSRVITIRDTKFFKSRLVPLGPRITKELLAFSKLRSALPMQQREESAFFASSTGRAIPYQHVITLFQRVRSAAGVQRDKGSSYPPRLHDLRHTAAVHRVIAWYRDGADVQRLLPQLATYLGHKDLRSTQHYLTMTPELLKRASLRFQHYADPGEDMPNRVLLGTWIRRFLLEHIIAERNLSHNTQTSYRDTLVLLLPFMRAHYKRPLEGLLIDDVSPQIVRLFLTHLESVRSCSVEPVTSDLPRFIRWRDSSAFAVPSISDGVRKSALFRSKRPPNRSLDTSIRRRWMRCCRSSTVEPFSRKQELRASPVSLQHWARADEAAHVHSADLALGKSPWVRITGKGNKVRVCPLWPHTAEILKPLVSGRVRCRLSISKYAGTPLTRFGIYRLVQDIANTRLIQDFHASIETNQPPHHPPHDCGSPSSGRCRHQHDSRLAWSRLPRYHQHLCGG